MPKWNITMSLVRYEKERFVLYTVDSSDVHDVQALDVHCTLNISKLVSYFYFCIFMFFIYEVF